MKQRFYLFRRRGKFYLQDSRTGKQQSLETKDRPTELRLLELKRQTETDTGFMHVAETCLHHHIFLRHREPAHPFKMPPSKIHASPLPPIIVILDTMGGIIN
jgi:hypothetical protein